MLNDTQSKFIAGKDNTTMDKLRNRVFKNKYQSYVVVFKHSIRYIKFFVLISHYKYRKTDRL